MSELIAGSAIAVPEQKKLEAFATLPATEQKEIVGQVQDMQSLTAEAVLKGADGYDILRELYSECAGLILSTSNFVIPVKQELPNICKHLADAEGFKRSFGTLCGDIANYNENLASLWEVHKDKSGAPSAEEITDVFDLATGYNKLATHYESGIQPLLVSLAETVEKEYTSILESELNATA
jgi:hypothetical protein